MTRTKTKAQGVYAYPLMDGTTRYGAVVDVQGAWGKGRVQKRREGFETLKAAKSWRTEMLSDILGGAVSPEASRTLGWWVREWLELRAGEIEFGTAESYDYQLNKFRALYRIPLAKLGPADIEMELVKIRATHAASTARSIRRTLSTCLNAAVGLELIARNPVRGTSTGRTDRTARDYWTREQVKAVLDFTADDEQWGVVWRVLADTWMRVGELCGLRWPDIDLDRGSVRIERTVRIAERGWVSGDSAKTKAAVRIVPISPATCAMLRQHRDRQRFLSSGGKVFACNPDQVRWALMDVCARMGTPRVGPHMFRHAGATMAARAKMAPEIIKERLGHSKVSFTLDMYVHPNAEDHAAAGALMAELLGS